MDSLIEIYSSVLNKIKNINENIHQTKQRIADIRHEREGGIPARITKLEEQLAKIDEYLPRIKGFQDIAKKNLESLNVLTIEAPPGYRVNLNRLRNWAMMIDPTSPDDAYAQRVYIVAKCDECFLEKKKAEFTAKIAELKNDESVGLNEEITTLQDQLSSLREELRLLALSEETTELAAAVAAENNKYIYKSSPLEFSDVKTPADVISPGAYVAPLPFDKEQRKVLKNQLGDFYDELSGKIWLPVELSVDNEFIITVSCAPSRRKTLDSAIQNLLLHLIDGSPVGSRRILVLDGVRYNSSLAGTLKKLEGTFALEQIPRNPDQLTAALEHLLSSFSDMDEILEMHDSVAEYNQTAPPDKRLPLTTLVLCGEFEGRNKELIYRIITNYERYGVSLIAVSYENAAKKNEDKITFLPSYALDNSVHISMHSKETTITFPDTEPQRFAWYALGSELADSYVESLRQHTVSIETMGNEYIKRYSLSERPQYTREYKKIELPFGIDGRDNAHTISFENENFAAYLVGASRSGKSTLLHTLIAGLIRNYHPDNLELWLADFKQLEFRPYIRHLPPHVKYVLLDESAELVYDLIDRLTNEMMERQKLFSRLGKQRIDEVDTTKLPKPLPVIFVILDEFSIMSQAIADSSAYKLKLQNILAKGAALGIKFLFSSQTFTTGVAGLTPTARAQIQQRISMKGTKDEISETLELSANLKTDQVRNWIDALPPHYALVKFRTGADTLPQVKRFLVMYFKNYTPRDDMIDSIASSMHAVKGYDPSDILSYADKQPVLVDGNSYSAFSAKEFLEYISELKSSGKGDYNQDEKFVTFGSPRLMTRMKIAALSSETRENLLLIARSAEQACAASVMLSVLKSYKLQGGKVCIWAYDRNPLFRALRNTFVECGFEIIEGIDSVCDSIRSMKRNMQAKVTSDTLIAMIGIDRICMDFDFVDGSAGKQQATVMELRSKLAENGAAASTDEQMLVQKRAQEWLKYIRPFVRQAKAEGKSPEEISRLKDELEIKFNKEYGCSDIKSAKSESMPQTTDIPKKAADNGAYNAAEDFSYIIKQGSRLGYHFFMQLSSLADLKSTGLKLDYFRYKLAFQISADDSRTVFGTKIASTLPEHICQFDDTLEHYSLRPYLHKGASWDGWYIDEAGNTVSPYEDSE